MDREQGNGDSGILSECRDPGGAAWSTSWLEGRCLSSAWDVRRYAPRARRTPGESGDEGDEGDEDEG